MYYDLIYSEDDGGYYCEICNDTGKTVCTTDVYKTEKEAENAAFKKYPQIQLLKRIGC